MVILMEVDRRAITLMASGQEKIFGDDLVLDETIKMEIRLTLVSENGLVGTYADNIDYTDSDWSGNVDRFEWI